MICQTGIEKLLAYVGEKETPASSAAPNRPMSKAIARKIHADNLEELRHAPDGAGNATLNTTAFFAARALAALEQTEEEIKDELLDIVTKEWKSPHPEHGARLTIDSG